MAVSIEAVKLLKPQPGEVLFVEVSGDATRGELGQLIEELKAMTAAAGWPYTPVVVLAANVDARTVDQALADLKRLSEELSDG